MKQDFRYNTSSGNTIYISVYSRQPFGQTPCVLYVHGFKGFKDWGFVPYLGESFVQAGLSLVTFNFSHNGIKEHGTEFTEFEKFKQNTFSLEVSEARELIHLCAHTDYFGGYIKDKPGILGHSRGGGIALLAAAQSHEIGATATWASVSSFDRYHKKKRQEWRKRGYMEVVNSRTGQVFQLGLDILNDLEKNAKHSLNIQQAAKKLGHPLLLLHGQNDETIPYFEAEHLNIYAEPELTTMRIIPKAGHTFGAKHPFQETNPALEQTIKLTTDFFLKHLPL